MRKALACAYLVCVAALLAAAAGAWRLRCEGFGCMGIGVAWFAWAVAFCVVLGMGWLARRLLAPAGGLARVCSGAWWLQLAAGAALLAVWASRSLA